MRILNNRLARKIFGAREIETRMTEKEHYKRKEIDSNLNSNNLFDMMKV